MQRVIACAARKLGVVLPDKNEATLARAAYGDFTLDGAARFRVREMAGGEIRAIGVRFEPGDAAG
jgi:hypothetical protein